MRTQDSKMWSLPHATQTCFVPKTVENQKATFHDKGKQISTHRREATVLYTVRDEHISPFVDGVGAGVGLVILVLKFDTATYRKTHATEVKERI